jgi:hypothetical protein
MYWKVITLQTNQATRRIGAWLPQMPPDWQQRWAEWQASCGLHLGVTSLQCFQA